MVEKDTEVVVEVTNEVEEGSIEVSKIFKGDPNKQFSFKVTGPNAYSESFKLKNGESWKSGDIPVGTYKVEETDNGYLATIRVGGSVEASGVTPLSVDVKVKKDKKVEVEVTNEITEEEGRIQIKKTYVSATIDPPAFFKLQYQGSIRL